MLDQITLADTIFLHISQQFFYAVELMIARPDLLDGFLFGILIYLFDNLCVVFYNPGQLSLGKDVLPEIVRHKAVRIRRISCAVVVAFIKRQEPAILSGELGAELNRSVVHSKMNHATLEREQEVMEVPVFLILAHSIFCVLLCELVFQLHRDDRKSVDKQANIQRQLSGILRITQLPRHAEDVLLVHDSGLLVIFGRSQVKHDKICRIDLYAIAQHIDNAAFGDFSGQPVQELALLRI